MYNYMYDHGVCAVNVLLLNFLQKQIGCFYDQIMKLKFSSELKFNPHSAGCKYWNQDGLDTTVPGLVVFHAEDESDM